LKAEREKCKAEKLGLSFDMADTASDLYQSLEWEAEVEEEQIR
jgi:hypothetical protein